MIQKLILAVVLAAPLIVTAREVSIENRSLRVVYSEAAGEVSLFIRPLPHERFAHGQLSQSQGKAHAAPFTDRHFGAGQAIEILYDDGSSDSLRLFRDLPFVVVQSRLYESGPNPTVRRHVRIASFTLDLGSPPSDLKILGTGGLVSPQQTLGSYAWLAVANPRTRSGVVSGWLTFDRGSGVVLSHLDQAAIRLDAQIDYGNLRLAPNATEALETFAIGWFNDARLGLEAWADAVAKVQDVHLPPQPVGYCTWYSRPHGGASDERHLAEQAAFAATNLAPFGFSVIQIDDGWQAGISTNGPKRNFTSHAPKGPYPSGMKATAESVNALGLVPGLWFMPFAGTDYDPFFQPHPDWFVQREDGQPYRTPWGGTSLDLTQPAVREYIRSNIERISRDWGFQYFKMDGLWTGTATRQMYVNDAYRDDGIGDAIFHDPRKTNLEAYRDGLKLIRQTAGPGVFILGCCTPQNMRSYGGAFGLVNAMRIGPDNGASWNDLMTGPKYGSRQYFLNGRVWYNDPDPVYVRDSVPLSEAQLICSWVAVSGQMNLSSEWFPSLPPERLDILKRTMPSHGLRPRPVDLFEQTIPRIWLLTDTRRSPRRDVVALYNWANEETTIECPLQRIGLDSAAYVAFDFWSNELVPLEPGTLRLKVPGRSCRILAVRPVLNRPQLLSTSRHVTQGIVDVLEEKWKPFSHTLEGASQLVGGDPYELRVALPQGERVWTLESATATGTAQGAAGVRVLESSQSDGLLRVRLEAPLSGQVHWRLQFKRAG